MAPAPVLSQEVEVGAEASLDYFFLKLFDKDSSPGFMGVCDFIIER